MFTPGFDPGATWNGFDASGTVGYKQTMSWTTETLQPGTYVFASSRRAVEFVGRRRSARARRRAADDHVDLQVQVVRRQLERALPADADRAGQGLPQRHRRLDGAGALQRRRLPDPVARAEGRRRSDVVRQHRARRTCGAAIPAVGRTITIRSSARPAAPRRRAPSADQVSLALQRDLAMESHFRGLAFWYRVGAVVFGGGFLAHVRARRRHAPRHRLVDRRRLVAARLERAVGGRVRLRRDVRRSPSPPARSCSATISDASPTARASRRRC